MTLREEIEQLIAKWQRDAQWYGAHGDDSTATLACAFIVQLEALLASLAQEQREQKEKIAQLERERWWSKYPSGNHP